MSKKVYCEDCKYSYTKQEIDHEKTISFQQTYNVPYKDLNFFYKWITICKLKKTNKDNNCRFYKRKWWKFWI